jgi:hypothetical protein
MKVREAMFSLITLTLRRNLERTFLRIIIRMPSFERTNIVKQTATTVTQRLNRSRL